ncbi:MAG: PHP domain-containing protein [Spirochaetota bacterium]
MRLKNYRLDLHIHTCLSPCGDNSMVPGTIISHAKMKNLDGIGISDHNSAENVSAVQEAAERERLIVLGGIEITTREEIHILGFFENNEALFGMQAVIYENLPGENNEEFFGEQLTVDSHDRVTGRNRRLLMGATNLSIDVIIQWIHHFKGIAIAAHIDRPSYSIVSQLGFIPEGVKLDALELSPHHSKVMGQYDYSLPLVTFSDAHYPDEIGKAATTFLLETATVKELKNVLYTCDGRRVVLEHL